MTTTDTLLDDAHAPVPLWPRRLGIFSICWGSFWMLCGGCGLAWVGFAPQLVEMQAKQLGEDAPAVIMPGMIEAATMLVGAAFDIVLIAAGVLTMRRRSAGRPLHLVYGITGVLVSLVALVNGVMKQLAASEWAAQNPTSKWADQAGSPAGWVMIVFFTLVGLSYPIFCLVWFGLKGKRPEVGAEAAARMI